jgi:hypothetical protein
MRTAEEERADAAAPRVCSHCGATNVGSFPACLRCGSRPRRGSRSATVLVLLPLLAGAGITVWQIRAGGNETTRSVIRAVVPTTTSAPAITAAPAEKSCTSADGYTVRYPADWWTQHASAAQKCHFFAAEPFDVVSTDTFAGDIGIDASATN